MSIVGSNSRKPVLYSRPLMRSQPPDGPSGPISSGPDGDDPEHPEAPQPTAAASPRFSTAGTIVSSVLVAAFVISTLFSPPGSRIESLDRPEEDLERLVGREMDTRHALETAPAWERSLDRFLSGNEDSLEQSIRWFDDLAREVDSPQVQLYRVILLAEAGRADRVSATIIPWQYQGEVMARVFEWVRAGYLGSPPDLSDGERLLSEVKDDLSPGWFADILTARIASGIGDQAAAAEAVGAILSRGALFLQRRRALEIAELVLLVAGCFFLVRVLVSPLFAALGTAGVPAPWGFRNGYALFVRGVLGFLIISAVLSYLLPDPSPLNGVVTLLAGTPLFWLIMKHFPAHGLAPGAVLGLRPPPDHARLSRITVILVSLSLLGELVIALVVAILHLKTDWTDGLLEDLLWAPGWAVFGIALDSIVWAPFVEEVAFRGVLYATLRTKMSMAPAALLSAGTFAVVHGYGMIGLASVFWSGLIWALAYERTRSLWPAILAHGVNNLVVTAEFLCLYR
jgi:membrane protease YdiL (CAAX protease family)